MDNVIKIRISLVVAFLVVLVVLFFQFNISKYQEAVLKQPDNKKSELAKEIPSVVILTHAEEVVEAKKIMPTKIPIFMYHYIRDYANPNDPIGENLSVSPKKFEEQIVWLKENGYQSVSASFFVTPQLVSFKPVVLTFDDGYQDAYDSAFPILKKYQMKGMFYLIVNKIGTPGYLTWDEIIQMQIEGMSFGSHTLTHPDLRNLSKMSLHKELEESKKTVEQKLGKEITDFCFPSGKYNEAVLKELQEDNYQTAVTTNPGISNVKDNLFLLKRLRITENTHIQATIEK